MAELCRNRDPLPMARTSHFVLAQPDELARTRGSRPAATPRRGAAQPGGARTAAVGQRDGLRNPTTASMSVRTPNPVPPFGT